MSDKPQEARVSDQEDLLDQIITQGLDRIKTPSQTAAAEEPAAGGTLPDPVQKSSGNDAPRTGRERRSSAVYLYLLILFGAAFLMLLLAYFVQRRGSENTISDLQDSMNLSRQELLAEIRKLEEQNVALKDQLTELRMQNAVLEQQITELRSQNDALVAFLDKASTTAKPPQKPQGPADWARDVFHVKQKGD